MAWQRAALIEITITVASMLAASVWGMCNLPSPRLPAFVLADLW